ncbi:MAG: tetratricopeptide repeat protein [Acidobacteriaceae bacterium]
MSLAKRLLMAVAFCVVVAQAGAQTATPAQAEALAQQGRLEESAQAWEAVVVAHPRDARALANLGLVRAREGQYAQAAEAYRKALAIQKMPGVELDLGLAEFKQGHLKEAIAPFEAALREQPGSLQARTLLGMTYYGTAQYAEAIPYLRAAVEKSPDNEELHGVLAQSCLYAKQYQCTLEAYRQILTLNPNSAQAHMLAGEAWDGMHEPERATAEFEAAEKVAPNEPNVHFGLGYLYWKQHRYADAEREFELELKNEPDYEQALAYLGDAEMRLEKTAAAEATLEKAVQVPAAIRLAWLDLGIVLAGEGKNEAAVADMRRAIAMDPGEVDAHWRLARLYQAMGQKEEARSEFAKAASLHQKADESLVQKMTPEAKP